MHDFNGTIGSMEMVEMRVYEFGVIVIRSGVDVLKRRQKKGQQQCNAGFECGDPAHATSSVHE